MAGRQEKMYTFTLQFKQEWSPQQLIRRGGNKDPLEESLRTASINQYDDVMLNPRKKTPKYYDFLVDDHGYILPAMSSGKSDIMLSISHISAKHHN